ncbi:hypothetical protein KGY79_08265 [Candidatus Bipolaricaulota bacterium]|nr:hypothetical protein [Candidatus Bipolaricaulota bacterium]
MSDAIINFFGLGFLHIVIICAVSTMMFPWVVRSTEEGDISFKEGFRRGLRQVYTYKWNIASFGFGASLLLVLPELKKIAWLGGLSINEVASVVLISVGTVSTVLSSLPVLGNT